MLNPYENDVVLFGETNFRGKQLFGIKMDDRRRHMYVIGKTGMGKSELLKNIAIQDIKSGRGMALIDPHGDLAEELLDYVPTERVQDVIYINPADLEFPVGFNVLESVDPDKRPVVAAGIMSVFKKLWADQWSSRMEYILSYTVLALLEVEGTTLLGINRMLAEKEYRKWIVNQVQDPEVKAFWTKEFASYTDRYTAEAVPAIQNKIGQFVSNVLMRNIVGQTDSSFNMRQAMDDGKILLINLSKGKIGEDASKLLGGLLITKIQLAAMSRVDMLRSERKDFVLIVDEFQNFATESFANILSEARKFNLSLVIAHQYVAQMDEPVRDAVFGNVGTIVSFRVGAEDAEMLEKEFAPEFEATDVVNLGKREIYLKLMMDGVASRAFSARTMDTMSPPVASNRDAVIDSSRHLYARKRSDVEETILNWRQADYSALLAADREASGLPAEQEEPSRNQPPRRYPPRESADRQPPAQRQPYVPRPPRSDISRPADRHEPPRGLPLDQALRSEPAEFKRPHNNTPPVRQTAKAKPAVDLAGLHEVLSEAMGEDEDSREEN